MTTIPLPKNPKNKPQVISISAIVRMLAGFVLLLGAPGQVAAQTSDAAEQLFRRGYPNNVALEWAVADYNSAHRLDSVAKDYPELKVAEILPAIARAITETPKKEKKKLAKLAALQKLVLNESLPRGSRLTFQYDGTVYRTPYEAEWGKLADKFAIVLFSGLDENPPGYSQYDEKAFIFGVVIRFHKRIDHEWIEEGERIAEKMKRKKER